MAPALDGARTALRRGAPPARPAAGARTALGDRGAVYPHGAPALTCRPSVLEDLGGADRPTGGRGS